VDGRGHAELDAGAGAGEREPGLIGPRERVGGGRHLAEHGGEGEYFCRIPFAVGMRELNSLDLRQELPELGLPQFCRPTSNTPEPLMIQSESVRGVLRVLDPPVATSVDIACAAIAHQTDGHEVLTLKLNEYASALVQEVAQQTPLTTLLCSQQIDGPKIVTDRRGLTSFTYTLSPNPAKAKKQIHLFPIALLLFG
jgi:hypothetical protein